MKWFASLGRPSIDWPCVIVMKMAVAATPSRTLRTVGMIQRMVTPA
jgi:hypothetical protein